MLDVGRFARDTAGEGPHRASSRPRPRRGRSRAARSTRSPGAFLTTVAQVAAVELRPKGITANVVVPARPPDEEAVSAVVDFLVSEQAAGVTGAVIAADGGFSVTKEPGGKPPLPGRG